jgi:hypothetical protein
MVLSKISTIGIGFSNRPIADFFHDQTICIADCENLTIGHSLVYSKRVSVRNNLLHSVSLVMQNI